MVERGFGVGVDMSASIALPELVRALIGNGTTLATCESSVRMGREGVSLLRSAVSSFARTPLMDALRDVRDFLTPASVRREIAP